MGCVSRLEYISSVLPSSVIASQHPLTMLGQLLIISVALLYACSSVVASDPLGTWVVKGMGGKDLALPRYYHSLVIKDEEGMKEEGGFANTMTSIVSTSPRCPCRRPGSRSRTRTSASQCFGRSTESTRRTTSSSSCTRCIQRRNETTKVVQRHVFPFRYTNSNTGVRSYK